MRVVKPANRRFKFHDAVYHVGPMSYFVRVRDQNGWLWGMWFDKQVYEQIISGKYDEVGAD